MADVVLPASAELVRGGGHGHQQRAARAARAARRSTRPARRATTRGSSSTSRRGSATSGTTSRPRTIWNELRSLAPNHAGMSYARLEELGGIQWPCYDEDTLEPSFLHGRLWEQPLEGPPAPFHVVEDEPPVDSSRRSSRCASPPAAGSTRSTPACRPAATPRRCARRGARAVDRRRRASSASTDGERVRVTSRARQVVAPVRVDRALRPGLAFMTLHFPDEVETNLLTIDATDPKSGTAEFKATAIRVEPLAPGEPEDDVRRRRPGDARRPAPLMDIVLHKDEPSAGEREAVDAVLGPPDSRWVGALTHVRPRPPRRPRRPRGARPAAPAAAGAPRRAGAAPAGSAPARSTTSASG